MSYVKAVLEAELQALVESDGDAAAISALISRIDSMGDESTEQEVTSVVSAKTMGIAPTVVAPVELQATLSEKESNVTSISLTKEALGIGGEFKSALKALSLDEIKAAMVEVEDTENLSALIASGVSQITAETRIHVEQRGEIRRAARGYALFAAGGISDGQITSPDGSIHFVEEGVCYEKSLTVQPDSFTGFKATIERTTPCLGHLEYKNTGSSDKPKFVKTGREYTRCYHQWALMFAAGYFITFNRELYSDVIITEVAQRVGDESAREVADEQIAEWRASSQDRFETRKAYAQAINHAGNAMGLPEGSRLPDVPEVLEYKLPAGNTLREAILDLKGAAFVVEFTVPVNGEESLQRVKAVSLNEVRSRMAPAFALAKTQGGAIKVSSVKAA